MLFVIEFRAIFFFKIRSLRPKFLNYIRLNISEHMIKKLDHFVVFNHLTYIKLGKVSDRK